jgi:DNA-binding CsgD family transcriptional regulator
VTALAAVARRLETLRDLSAFGPLALGELAELVPFDHGVFNQVDPVVRLARFDVHPPGQPAPAWTFDTYDGYLPQNPIFRHVQETRDGATRRLSDLVDANKLHHLPLYLDILRPLGIEYQVAFSIAYRRPLILAFALSRRWADFSDDEVAILDLLRPHLSRNYRRLCLHSDQTVARFERTFGLTQREAEILDALVRGMTIDEIATQFAVAAATVRKHSERVYRKLGVVSRAGATALASRVAGPDI